MKDYIKLLRVQHWIKNGLVFLPLIFSGSRNLKEYMCVGVGFVCFSMLASAIYAINDICDVEKDRMHEVKKNRPIASGRVSVPRATALAVVLLGLAVVLDIMFSGNRNASLLCLVIYFGMNVLYSRGLKDKPIIDVTILAFGFVIRVVYGSALSGIESSPMLLLTVFLFALYMGLGKRRNEKRKIKENTREVLERYTDAFLDKNMYMCLNLGIVFYAIWTMGLGGYAVYTVALVVLICMRYNMIIESESYGDPVEVLCSDKILIALVLLFSVLIMLVIRPE